MILAVGPLALVTVALLVTLFVALGILEADR